MTRPAAPTPSDTQDLTSHHRVFHSGAEWSFSTGTIVKRFLRDDQQWLLVVPPDGDPYLIDYKQRMIALEPEFDTGPYRI